MKFQPYCYFKPVLTRGWTFCSLLVTRYFLLVARCTLLFARCLLLFARCSLLITFCSLLVARYFLLVDHCSLLFGRCSLLFACCSWFFRPNYCKMKLLWTTKKWLDYNVAPPQIFSLQIFEIFVPFSWWWFLKFSEYAKPFSKLTQSHKYYGNWYHFDVFITIPGHVFIYFYVLEQSATSDSFHKIHRKTSALKSLLQ